MQNPFPEQCGPLNPCSAEEKKNKGFEQFFVGNRILQIKSNGVQFIFIIHKTMIQVAKYEQPSYRTNSSDESSEEQSQNRQWQCPSLRNMPITIIAILGFIILSATLFFVCRHQLPVKFSEYEFDFRVYCPISSDKNLVKREHSFLEKLPFTFKPLLKHLKFQKTYVVTVRSVMSSLPMQNIAADQQVQFCGLARPWNGSCQNYDQLEYVCSNPGPIFDLKTHEEIYVFWVNAVEKINVSQAFQASYNQANDCFKVDSFPDNYTDNYPQQCFLKTKGKDWKGCTYFDPTDLGVNSTTPKVPVGFSNYPISPHIHGLQVRPYFDGNPLAWISRKARGIGYMSYEQDYFNVFTDQERQTLYEYFNSSAELSRLDAYPNTQPPGSLWYHDHAMSTTGFSTMKGLKGLYILRDNKTEEVLPKGQYQVYALLHHYYEPLKVACQLKTFKTDAWYRVRILNTNFARVYFDLRFQGPTKERLPFTLIGQDGALMRTPVPNLTAVTVASAERVDVLIKFDSKTLKKGDMVQLHYRDFFQRENDLVRMEIGDQETNQTILDYVPPKQLDVPFKNLTDPDIVVSKKRMRILQSRGSLFSTNGHTMFDQGKSENPQVGTVEDWFLINTDSLALHPFHFHLVNFQIVRDYTLKVFKTPENYTCAYYEIDFFLKYANKTQCFPQQIKKSLNEERDQGLYDRICDFLNDKKLTTRHKLNQCFSKLKMQQDFDSKNISGINVEESVGDSKFKYSGSTTPCDMPGYKYLCKNATQQFPIYNRGWKDIGLVLGLHVLNIRIRWTKTAYDAKVDGTNYFDVPEKNLLEFPGFIYHCHFLNHEDNLMMRPIMIQPSEHYKKNNLPLWNQTYKKVNEQLGCGAHDGGDDLRRN